MSEQETPLGLTKWQLGLLVGVPVAVVAVAGVWWYLQSSNENEKEDEKAETTVETPVETPTPKAAEEEIDHMGQFEDVVTEASKALELNNRYTKALMRRARAYEQLDKKEECLQDVAMTCQCRNDLTAVCLLEGFNNPDWMIHADRVLKSIGKEKAHEHFKNRKPAIPSAIAIKAYLDSYSQDDILSDSIRDEEGIEPDTPFVLALDDIKQRKFDNIVFCFCMTGEGPCYAKALALRGTMYTLMSQVEDAITDLTEVITMDDDKASIKLKISCLLKRASLKVEEGTVDSDAENDFQTAITLDSSNSDIYHQRGLIYFMTERLDDAREDFQKCLELNPNFIQAKIQLAYCIYKKAQLMQSSVLAKGAMDEFERISKEHPDSPDALGLHAQALQEQGEFENAMEKYAAAHKIQPENPVHLVYKGLLMVQWKQDFEKAVELVQSAIDLDRKCDFAYETLATLEVQRGNLDKAIQLFDEALLLVRTEGEMAQTYALREAAIAQNYVTNKMGIKPNIFMG
ncbi:hypothetical protein QZH41_013302 [Actinostola sp. cb2023]|nr:hypothetical protein QZH41_013302 [Actinostola sp. cb2023]